MDKAEGKRTAENEDEGVKKLPRLSMKETTNAPEVAPGTRTDGRYVYELGENLTSRCTYSQVLECWDDVEKECVAIKVSRTTISSGATQYKVTVLEKLAESVEARSRCVQFRHWFQYREHDCIVFEKLGPSLRDFLNGNKCRPVPVDLVQKFGRQLLEALVSMHDMTIIHTDLKPENILLVSSAFVKLPVREKSSSDEVQFRYWPKSSAIKLSDFGSCISNRHRIQVNQNTRKVSTRCYRAPEIILGIDWTYPIDLWSVGCILAELCTGQTLFPAYPKLNLEHLAMLERVLGRLPEHMAQGASQENKIYFGTGSILNWPEGASSADTTTAVNKHEPLKVLVSRHVESSKVSVLMDLLNGLLTYDPLKRLTARQALEHPFFTNSTWEIDQEGNWTVTHAKK